ncbi:hypothetical protein ACQKWADRAFT_289478 [Trichoderma austrokoningii]
MSGKRCSMHEAFRIISLVHLFAEPVTSPTVHTVSGRAARVLSQLNKLTSPLVSRPRHARATATGPMDWSLPWSRKALAGNHVATNLLPKHTHSGPEPLSASFSCLPDLAAHTEGVCL